MDRRIELLRYVTRQQRGIEIAPWFNPVVPKRAGYRTLILDLFDAQNLRRNAESDANVPKEMIPNIEEVDLTALIQHSGGRPRIWRAGAMST